MQQSANGCGTGDRDRFGRAERGTENGLAGAERVRNGGQRPVRGFAGHFRVFLEARKYPEICGDLRKFSEKSGYFREYSGITGNNARKCAAKQRAPGAPFRAQDNILRAPPGPRSRSDARISPERTRTGLCPPFRTRSAPAKPVSVPRSAPAPPLPNRSLSPVS